MPFPLPFPSPSSGPGLLHAAGFQPRSTAITPSSCRITKRSRHGFEARAKPLTELLRKNSFLKTYGSCANSEGKTGSHPLFGVFPSPAEAAGCGDVCDHPIQKTSSEDGHVLTRPFERHADELLSTTENRTRDQSNVQSPEVTTTFWLKTCHESEDEFVLANMIQLRGWSDVLNSSPRVRPLFSAQV